MKDELFEGDKVLVLKKGAFIFKSDTIKKNDVVVFNYKFFQYNYMIKRVEHVFCSSENQDLFIPSEKSAKNYFLTGDNKEYSIDSRHIGVIQEDSIIGKAIFVIFNYHKGKFRWDRFFKKIE